MLDFSLSNEQKMLKIEFARMAKDRIGEDAGEMDESGQIPKTALDAAWEMGAVLSNLPQEYGGFAEDDNPVDSVVLLEEMAYADMAFAVAAALPSLFLYPVFHFGTDDQKKTWIPQFAKEDYPFLTFAFCEPGFGFDPKNLGTRAEKKNGKYILSGKKIFVPMAKEAGHMLVAAEFDGQTRLFITPKDAEGIEIGDPEKNLGLYALPTFPVRFTETGIPEDCLVGGSKAPDFDLLLARMRTGTAAIATGVARAALERAKAYAKERVQFGEPIAHRQSVAFMIAEMAYEVDSMRLLTWKAASAIRADAGEEAKKAAFLARRFAGEKAMRVADFGVQIFGGHGYIREYPMERYYRNARAISIYDCLAIV